jgi:hypothetical protein
MLTPLKYGFIPNNPVAAIFKNYNLFPKSFSLKC